MNFENMTEEELIESLEKAIEAVIKEEMKRFPPSVVEVYKKIGIDLENLSNNE